MSEADVTAESPEREFSIRQYVEILRRRWSVAAAVFALTLLAAILFTVQADPLYRASAAVAVDPITPGAIDVFQPLAARSQSSYISTLVAILQSRTILAKAFREAGIEIGPRDAVNLRVTPVRDPSLLNITVTDRSPTRAVRMANVLAQALIDLSLQSRKRQASAVRSFLEEQARIAERDVRRVEERLLRFKIAEGNVALSQTIELKVDEIAKIEAARAAAEAELKVTETRLADLRQRLARFPQISPSAFAQDALVQPLRAQLLNAEVEMAALLERYTEAHPAVVAARARVRDLKTRLEQALAQPLGPVAYAADPIYSMLRSQLVSGEVEVVSLRARRQALEREIARLSQDIERLPPRELALARLVRDMKIAEGAFLLLSQKYQEARIAEASVVPDIRIVDPAELPTAPVSPNVVTNLLFGLFFGLFFSLVAALGVDLIDQTMRTAEDAERATGLPVLAVIPAVPRSNSSSAIALVRHNRKSPSAEAFRGLRTGLLFSSPDNPLKTIMVASALSGEGKTMVAVNLAFSFAQLGRKVWLVEGDLRKPNFLHIFQPSTTAGLADYLVGAVPLAQIVKPTEDRQVEYIPSGSLAPNPAELISSHKMRDFLAEAKAAADIVVVDSAPLGPVVDSLLLAPEVDGVVLVVEAGRTPRDVLQQMVRRLEAARARTLGLVLTKARAGARGYGYYGQYPYSYEEEDLETAPAERSRV